MSVTPEVKYQITATFEGDASPIPLIHKIYAGTRADAQIAAEAISLMPFVDMVYVVPQSTGEFTGPSIMEYRKGIKLFGTALRRAFVKSPYEGELLGHRR